MAQAAAVIDLDTFRRRRSEDSRAPERRAAPATVAAPASAYLVPVWVTWVPMWLVH